jgi:hypothetical protein
LNSELCFPWPGRSPAIHGFLTELDGVMPGAKPGVTSFDAEDQSHVIA